MKQTNQITILLALFTFCLLGIIGVVYFHTNNPHKQITQTIKQQNHIPSSIGVNVDMSQILPGSLHYVVDKNGKDIIDTAHENGITVLRIVSGTPSFPGTFTPYIKQQWDTVLNKMQSYHINAIILVESPSEQKDFYQGTFTSDHTTLLKQLILDSDVPSHENVLAIDLKNEPILTPENLDLLRQEAAIIKEKYPHMLVTVGGWRIPYTNTEGKTYLLWNRPQDAKLLDGIVDLYSAHIYHYDQQMSGNYPNPQALTTDFLTTLSTVTQGKPIIIGEFGASNGDAFTDQATLGSKELQSNIYAGVYQSVVSLQKLHVIGAVSYDYTSRNNKPDGWQIASPTSDYFYPAFTVLKHFAKGGTQYAPFTTIPKDYIRTNQENGKTISIKKGDIIGFLLTTDFDPAISVNLSDPSPLQQTQPFVYDGVKKQYTTVFHALTTGTVHLAISSKLLHSYTQTILISN